MFLSQETRSGHYTVAQTLTNQHFFDKCLFVKVVYTVRVYTLTKPYCVSIFDIFFLFHVYWCVIMSASKETGPEHLLLHKL